MITIFLSYNHQESKEADIIYQALTKEGFQVDKDSENLNSFDNLRRFMESIKEHQYVVKLISLSYFKSFNCMFELSEFMGNNPDKTQFSKKTLPILIKGENDVDIFSNDWQLGLVSYWQDQKDLLERGLLELQNKGVSRKALEEKRREVVEYEKITDSIIPYTIFLTRDIVMPTLDKLINTKFDAILKKIKTDAPPLNKQSFKIKKYELQCISAGIIENSYNNIDNPEYPPFAPKFPATPIIPIKYHDKELLIKDESYNVTGTHKDRMAWEIILYYKKLIDGRISANNFSELPAASLISTGSAAIAIQTQLRIYNLPNLRVIVDEKIEYKIITRLKSIGIDIYKYDLNKKLLSSEDILQITENESGFDITNRDWIDPNRRTYYDWLCYEILNAGAKWIFVPVGTGDLYQNILSVLRNEVLEIRKDSRLDADIDIKHINVIGVTTDNSKTCMDKLYAHYRPTLDKVGVFLEECKKEHICSQQSRIHYVKEENAKKALEFAKNCKITTEASGISGLAGYMELEYKVPVNEKVIIVNTGWLHLSK